MEAITNGIEEESADVIQAVGRRKIRSKLLWSFMILIALTLLVIAITLISQTYAQRTINDLVQVQGKIARLSLETEGTLRIMEGYEKDFLLQHERVGIRDAKEQYLTPFIEQGGEAYRTLYEIQSISEASGDTEGVQSAQSAMDSINEYLSAFVGTVNILELRVDKEFGELVKLQESVDALGEAANAIPSPRVRNQFFLLKAALQDYLMVQTPENAMKVVESQDKLEILVQSPTVPAPNKAVLNETFEEFVKWFAEVKKTDATIVERIQEYQTAAAKAEPIIRSFLDSAVKNEAVATKDMEDTSAMVQKIVLGVGLMAVLFAIFIAIRLSKGLTNQVNHIMGLLGEMEAENYGARTEVVSDDELGVMAVTLNNMLDNITILIQSQDERNAIQESIMKLLEEISILSDGDFTARAEVTEDLTGAIADSFNAMADQFSDIISKVKVATEAVGVTSDEVSRQTMELAEKNIDQVKGVTTAVEAIDEMVGSIKNVAENAQTSALVSKQSRKNAQEGAEAVQETNKAMSEIREEINETARSVKRLGESSLEIGNIVQIIDDIADRTSILALNASIQAAMAGDAGHGFAVVADEVQRLADSSSNSTKQIEVLVKSIQAEIKDLTTRIDESISKVVAGSQLADGAHDKLQEIENVSRQLAELIDAITAATNNQVQMSETISKTMEDVGEVSRESSLSTQDTAASMNILSKTARDLRSAVDVFKIGETEEA
ncbi:methyl-accepting chemotaxis protein [Desulforhopalus sp. 52FAK]